MFFICFYAANAALHYLYMHTQAHTFTYNKDQMEISPVTFVSYPW